MPISHHHQFVSRSRDIADIIEGAQYLHTGMTRLLGRIISTIIAYLGLPVLNIILFFANRILKKAIEKPQNPPENARDYKDIRLLYYALNESINRMKKVGNPDTKAIPFGFRTLNRQINYSLQLMTIRHTQISTKLKQLDAHKEQSSSFEFIPEELLWQNRTKAYTYKI